MNMMAAWLSFQLANLVVRKIDNVKAARGEHVKGKGGSFSFHPLARARPRIFSFLPKKYRRLLRSYG